MQSLMQKMTATAILFVFFLASAHADDPAAAVPSPYSLRPSPATIQFVKAYAAYAQAVRDHDTNEMKAFVTSDFALKSDFALRGEGAPLTGSAAFKELDACRIDLPGTLFSAAVHPLSVTETDAVALSEETYAFQMKLRNQNTAGSIIEDWKQIWRKTPQGWKLASIEAYRGDFAHVEGVTFTVLRDAKSDPAKAQEKQNAVK